MEYKYEKRKFRDFDEKSRAKRSKHDTTWSKYKKEKTDERNKSETVGEGVFNWEEHRYALDHMFFHPQAAIKKGTEKYDDLWKFVRSYNAIQIKKKESGKISSSGNALHIQKCFQVCSRINFFTLQISIL